MSSFRFKTDMVEDRSTKQKLSDKLASVDASLAEMTNIKGTTQFPIFNTDGTVQKVQHKDASNNIVREDVFTYTTNLITEVRTVGTNSITFKYHLDTLQTEVI